MKLKPHPRYAEFVIWMNAQIPSAGPLKGEYFRVAGPQFTTAADIISGIGAFKGGGRWNPPAVMRAIYLSDRTTTAMHEAVQNLHYYGIPEAKGMPKLVVAIAVDVSTALQLTDGAIAASLPIPMGSLLGEDWRAIMGRGEESTAQAIGRAAFQCGIQGLIVPSNAAPGHKNMLLFPDLLHKSNRVEVLQPELLEKLGQPS